MYWVLHVRFWSEMIFRTSQKTNLSNGGIGAVFPLTPPGTSILSFAIVVLCCVVARFVCLLFVILLEASHK